MGTPRHVIKKHQYYSADEVTRHHFTKSIQMRISKISTPLGNMLAIADNKAIHLLAFQDSKNIEKNIEQFEAQLRSRSQDSQDLQALFFYGTNKLIEFLATELNAYFKGQLTSFTTPIYLCGTDFQKTAWQALANIPYGETQSYGEQAKAAGTPTAFRAVANANGANQIAIVIPCHRVIASNGTLGGYAGGIERKQWLLDHERHIKNS